MHLHYTGTMPDAPKTQDAQLVVRISTALLEVLDDVRRAEKDVPTRPEMIRRLIERASTSAKHQRPGR
jgi:hypothetical protein